MMRLVAAGLLTLSLAGAGCSTTNDVVETDTTSAEQAGDTASAQPDGVGTDAVRVVVLDPGAEPRIEFRHRWDAGDEVRFETTQVTAILLTVDEASSRIPRTELTTSSVATVESVDADGVGAIRIENLGVDGAVGTPDEAVAAAEATVGLVMVGRVDADGVAQDLTADFPEGYPEPSPGFGESLLQSLRSMSVPLPGEALGAGARWQAVSIVDVFGLEVEQTLEFTVVDVDESGADVTFRATQRRVGGTFTMPGLPAGADVEVTRWDMDLSGSSRVVFGQLIAEGRTAGTVNATMEFTSDEAQIESLSMDMHTEQEIHVG